MNTHSILPLASTAPFWTQALGIEAAIDSSGFAFLLDADEPDYQFAIVRRLPNGYHFVYAIDHYLTALPIEGSPCEWPVYNSLGTKYFDCLDDLEWHLAECYHNGGGKFLLDA